MSDTFRLLTSIPWFAWIAIVAIISGCVSGVVKMRYQHLERLEMIRQGMNPDAPAGSTKPLGMRDF
jgi:hypothetical protein